VTISSFLSSPIYKATARILIEKETPNVLSFKEVLALDTSDTDYYQTQYTILKSRTLAKQVLQKLGIMDPVLVNQAQGFSIRKLFTGLADLVKSRKPLSEEAKRTAQEQQIIDDFLHNTVTIEPIRGSRLVDVSADSTDPDLATRLANTLVDVYIEQNLEAKLSASKDAVNWLAKQLEASQQKVAESEAALQRYKEEHAIISFEDRQNIITQKLLELNTAVNNARIKRITIESKYNQIQQYLNSNQDLEKIDSLSEVINNPLIQKLKVDMSSLETEMSELLKTFRDKHPKVIALHSQIATSRNRINAEVNQIVTSIVSEYELAQAQEKDMTAALEDQKQEAMDLSQKAIEYGVLEREFESNKRIYNELLQRTKETSVTEQLETNNIRVVDRAMTPTVPIAPRKKLNIFLAMVVGLVFGTVLAFFFEYLDNSIKTPEDIKQYLDMPFLGFIPKVAAEATAAHPGAKQSADTIVALEPRSTASEAYRSLRTNVMFSSLEHGPIILVTSAGPTEGKSITVANLGITMAQSGSKTLIIDGDLRKPRMHRIFNIPITGSGLTDLIANFGTNGTRITVKRTKIENLDILPCGKIPPNPSELLGSERMKLLLEALAKKYDKILIDSPPVTVVTDPVILSRIAGGVIIIIRAGETRRDVVRRAKEQLRNVNATILGGVLNSVDIEKDNYYYSSYYHYNYYYQRKDELTE
jgi:succinoglycan biosynthesis transport protein ExoP